MYNFTLAFLSTSSFFPLSPFPFPITPPSPIPFFSPSISILSFFFVTLLPEIGTCWSLKNLYLFDNRLSGEIPAELGKMVNLEVISAAGNNELAGKIPPEIGNCRNLTFLGLADTRISGYLPRTLGKLSKLQTLSNYTAMLSGEFPSEIGLADTWIGVAAMNWVSIKSSKNCFYGRIILLDQSRRKSETVQNWECLMFL